ncbi:hypothetical protein C8F01DRAFT_674977 [Mycena amicta]|nr:hypothetical protein C8F01DRAFT_674977 [Mycena amicta]
MESREDVLGVFADDHSYPLGWLGQCVKISVTHPRRGRLPRILIIILRVLRPFLVEYIPLQVVHSLRRTFRGHTCICTTLYLAGILFGLRRNQARTFARESERVWCAYYSKFYARCSNRNNAREPLAQHMLWSHCRPTYRQNAHLQEAPATRPVLSFPAHKPDIDSAGSAAVRVQNKRLRSRQDSRSWDAVLHLLPCRNSPLRRGDNQRECPPVFRQLGICPNAPRREGFGVRAARASMVGARMRSASGISCSQ